MNRRTRENRPCYCASGMGRHLARFSQPARAVRQAAQVPKRAESTPVEETRSSNLRDAAGLFGAQPIAAARKELRDLESKTGVPTIIATVETLDERPIEDEAPIMARESGIEGIFILISKKERRIQVIVSHRYLGRDDEDASAK